MDIITPSPNYEPISMPISMARKSSVGNASYTYHRHNACEVFLFLSGNIRFYIEQTCFSPAPGSLIVLNPQEMHRVQSMDDSPYERIVINIQKDYVDALSPDGFSLANCFYARPLGLQNVRILSSDAVNEFLSLYDGLESSAVLECFGSTVVRNAYSSLLLLFINRQFQSALLSVKIQCRRILQAACSIFPPIWPNLCAFPYLQKNTISVKATSVHNLSFTRE